MSGEMPSAVCVLGEVGGSPYLPQGSLRKTPFSKPTPKSPDRTAWLLEVKNQKNMFGDPRGLQPIKPGVWETRLNTWKERKGESASGEGGAGCRGLAAPANRRLGYLDSKESVFFGTKTNFRGVDGDFLNGMLRLRCASQ